MAAEYGAKVLNRPKELADDIIMPDASLVHFAENVDFDILVFIQPTSPLIDSNDINSGLALIQNNSYDSVFSAYKEHWLPRWSLDKKPDNWKIDNRPMRQEIDEKYVENGAFYITTKHNFLKSNILQNGNVGFVVMKESESIDIDTYEDLELVNKIIKGSK